MLVLLCKGVLFVWADPAQLGVISYIATYLLLDHPLIILFESSQPLSVRIL
jgi:hypothetical protein